MFLATLLAGWRWFADQGSWVLTVGLFVLVVGVQHPVQYAVGYTTLTLLGGCVAVAVNTLLPSFPLAQSQDAVRRLATTLADQLDDLAEGCAATTRPGRRSGPTGCGPSPPSESRCGAAGRRPRTR